MTPDERKAWKDRMDLARKAAKERRLVYAAERAYNAVLVPARETPEYYGEEDFAKMHPSLAMVFRSLYEEGSGPIRKNVEPGGCDCGNC